MVVSLRYQDITLDLLALRSEYPIDVIKTYFQTREEALICLYTRLMQDWNIEVLAYFKTLDEKTVNLNDFSKGMVKTLTNHIPFLCLSPFLYETLQSKIAPPILERFLKFATNVLETHTQELMRIFPSIEKSHAQMFLKMLHASYSMTWAATFRRDDQSHLIDKTDFQAIKSDFVTDMYQMIYFSINGILAR